MRDLVLLCLFALIKWYFELVSLKPASSITRDYGNPILLNSFKEKVAFLFCGNHRVDDCKRCVYL